MTEIQSPETEMTSTDVVPGTETAPAHLVTPGETAEQLVTAERQVIELSATILSLESRLRLAEGQLQEARVEQITDGGDPRLAEFWERAGRIADHAEFCSEYDRMAEAMNGPRRRREYEVTAEFEVTVRITRTVEAVDGEEAEYLIDSGGFTRDEIEEAISDNGIDDWTLVSKEAEEA